MLVLYKNIKARRTELKMTQTELAHKVGYSEKSSIAKIESGAVDLPLSKVKEIAKALDCSASTLMGWDDIDDNDVPVYDTKDSECLLLFSKLSETQKDNILNLMRSM